MDVPAAGLAPDCCVAVGAGRVLVASVDRPLTCLDLADGSVLWAKEDLKPPIVSWVAGRFFVHGERGWCEVQPDGTPGEWHPFMGLWEAGGSLLGTGTGLFVTASDLKPVLKTNEEHGIRYVLGRTGVSFRRGIVARDLETEEIVWQDDPGGRILRPRDLWKGKLLYQEVRRHELGPGKGIEETQRLVCRDAARGGVEWSLPVKAEGFASVYWVTEGEPDRVYLSGPTRIPGERCPDEFRLSCFDFVTGAEIVEETVCTPGPELRELALGEAGVDYGATTAVALSPSVVWVKLQYFLGSPQRAFLVAIDRKTGKPLWKQKIPQSSGIADLVGSRLLMVQERSLLCYGPKPPRARDRQ